MSVVAGAGPADPVEVETRKVTEEFSEQIQADYDPPQVKRDAHPKMHGCVQAELKVREDLPDDLRSGVFQPGKSYLAWIRFSNAFRIQHDLQFDTRGMAIKLLDVPGAKPWSDEPGTQDFLLATHDAFFMADHNGYAEFAEAVGRNKVFAFFTAPRRWSAFVQLVRSMLVLARNPLAISYFSQTPYKLGRKLEVKLQARPVLTRALGDTLPAWWWFRCQAIVANLMLIPGRSLGKGAAADAWCERYIADRNCLRLSMMAFLADHGASFDLLVQRRVDSPRMPINDATRRWPRELSDFEKVATITIPRQVFWPQVGLSPDVERATNKMMWLGEHMSFNPWHALADHEPLGDINKMRKGVYPAIATLRRGLNRVDLSDMKLTREEYNNIKTVVQ